jgi:hypothetical protein
MRKRAKDFVPDPTSMLSVYVPDMNGYSTRCIGFLLARKDGYEAFTDDRSLGVYPSQRAAADALSGAVS